MYEYTRSRQKFQDILHCFQHYNAFWILSFALETISSIQAFPLEKKYPSLIPEISQNQSLRSFSTKILLVFQFFEINVYIS